MTLTTVGDSYECAALGEIRVHQVDCPSGEPAARMWQRLPGQSESESNPLLADAVKTFRRAMWRVNTSLLPPNHPDLRLAAAATELQTATEPISLSAGARAADLVSEAALALADFAASDRSPLMEQACELLGTGRDSLDSVLVLIGRSQIQEVESQLRSLDVESAIIERSGLRGSPTALTMVLIGSPRWYPRSLFTAPRALETAFVSYNWLGAPPEIEGLLPAPSVGVERQIVSEGDRASMRNAPRIPDLELVPTPNWDAISRRVTSDILHEHDPVEARAFILGGGRAAFFDSSGESDILCASREHSEIKIDRRSPVTLPIGDYVVLRTSHSSPDYIRELADVRFGALEYRPLLVEWKTSLRHMLATETVKRVQWELLRRGARTSNVRYWASDHCIAVRSGTDFRILLDYLGLGDRADALRAASEHILTSHIQAGVYIRKQLEDLLANVDLAALDLAGWVEFELEEDKGGGIGLFQVLHISPDTVSVSADALRKPFPIGENEWHE